MGLSLEGYILLSILGPPKKIIAVASGEEQSGWVTGM